MTTLSEESGIPYKVIHHIQEDTSGKRENTHRRLELLELSRRIESGSVDFIVVEKLDRLSRDEIFNLILAEKLVKFGVELFLIDGGKVDFRQSGDRWKFKIDNIRAGEYSEDLSQKVSIKLREAMVNNGKDPKPTPVLGLDKHDVWVGMYSLNKKELNIVVDIMEKFIELKGSRQGILKYCKDKNYKTKTWFTAHKVSKDGRRLAPRKMGGTIFTWDGLMRLLKNPKYRGINSFYDYYAQFPEMQDEFGYVTWEYFHWREHGDIIDPKLLEKVDELAKTVEWKPRLNEFFMAGVAFAPNDSRYYGEAAKSGKNYYYYDRKSGHRIIACELHKIVTDRLKMLLEEGEYFEKLIKQAAAQQGSRLDDLQYEKMIIRSKIEELKNVENRFSESIRALVLKGSNNLENAIALLIEDKNKAEREICDLKCNLREIEEQEKNEKKATEESSLKAF